MALLFNFIKHFEILLEIYLLILLITHTNAVNYQIPKNKQ